MYNSSPGAFLVQGWWWSHFAILCLLLLNDNIIYIKYFGHHTYLLTSHFRGHLLHEKNPPSIGKKNWLAEEQFSLCEIRSTRPSHGWLQVSTRLEASYLRCQRSEHIVHPRWSRSSILEKSFRDVLEDGINPTKCGSRFILILRYIQISITLNL